MKQANEMAALDRALAAQVGEALAPLAQLEARLSALEEKLERLRVLQVEIADDVEAIGRIVGGIQ